MQRFSISTTSMQWHGKQVIVIYGSWCTLWSFTSRDLHLKLRLIVRDSTVAAANIAILGVVKQCNDHDLNLNLNHFQV